MSNFFRDFWNHRASFGETAGTQDILAKELEIRELSKYLKDYKTVLDFGCGDGTTAIRLAKEFPVAVQGMDFSDKMIESAHKKDGSGLKGTVKFEVGDVEHLKWHHGLYDGIYTERMIINLPSWDLQKEAIEIIFDHLKPGGRYLMCENSQDGLDALNHLRVKVGLSIITPPSHNLYLSEKNLKEIAYPGVILESVNDYSSTYYFISRVLNAWVAKREGKEPAYDSPINNLAFDLPPIGNCGQGKMWVWRKLTYQERVKLVKEVEEAYRNRNYVFD